MRKNAKLIPWVVTGIFLWPLLALLAGSFFGQKGSDAVAYLGIAIIGYLFVWTFSEMLRLRRGHDMLFTYRTYRKAEQKACDEMHRLFGLYKSNFKFVGQFRDATKLYQNIRSRRKREYQKWPIQRYIVNTVIAGSLVRSMPRVITPEKCGAIPTTR